MLKNNFGRECDIVVPNFCPKPKNIIKKKNPIKLVWIANFKKLKRPELFIKLAEKFKLNKKNLNKRNPRRREITDKGKNLLINIHNFYK